MGSSKRWCSFQNTRRLPRTTAFLRRPFTGRFGAALFDFPTPRRLSFASSTTNAAKICTWRCSQESAKGIKAPAKVEMTGKQGGPLAIETFRKLCEEVEGEEVEDKDSSDRTKTK